MDRRQPQRGETSRDTRHQHVQNRVEYRQLPNSEEQLSQGASSSKWWEAGKRLLGGNLGQSSSDVKQLSDDVKRFLDINAQRVRMAQDGNYQYQEWNQQADQKGDQLFEKEFQKKLDRSASLRKMLNDEVKEREQSVTRYVNIMERRDNLMQQGRLHEWDNPASANDRRFMEEFETRLGNEPGLEEMRAREFDRRGKEKEQLQADVKKYADLMEHKGILMDGDRPFVWETHLDRDGNRDFVTRFKRTMKNDGGVLHEAFVAEMSRREQERIERYGPRTYDNSEPPPDYPEGFQGVWTDYNQ